jgi:hypothetical protein
MEIIYGVLGVALVAVVIVDALWTTLWVDGAAGPVTAQVTTWSWRAVLKLIGRRRHKALSVFGPVILMTTVVTWVLLLLAGWVLVFASTPQSLQSTSGPSAADWTGRIWFVAYSMFTVGNGDFAPRDGLWQVVASIVGASGMFLITLAISYLLSVLSAVVGKRAFAGQVAGLGASAEELVLRGWDGRDLHSLDRHLADLSTQLARLTQQYQSYPILQYYHAAKAKQSPVKAVGVLDDALTVMRFGVCEQARPEPATLASARSTVASFLEVLRESMVSPTSEVPPAPGIRSLRRRDIPTAADEEFEHAMHEVADRRRTLHGVIRSDGWDWEE